MVSRILRPILGQGQRVHQTGDGPPTHRMLIDAASVQAGIASLSSHVRYLEELPNHPKPDVFIPKMLEQPDGQPAVQFRVFDPV